MKRTNRVRNVRVRRKRRQAQAHRSCLERARSAVRDRRTVQPRAHGNAAVRKRLCQRLAVHIAAATAVWQDTSGDANTSSRVSLLRRSLRFCESLRSRRAILSTPCADT